MNTFIVTFKDNEKIITEADYWTVENECLIFWKETGGRVNEKLWGIPWSGIDEKRGVRKKRADENKFPRTLEIGSRVLKWNTWAQKSCIGEVVGFAGNGLLNEYYAVIQFEDYREMFAAHALQYSPESDAWVVNDPAGHERWLSVEGEKK